MANSVNQPNVTSVQKDLMLHHSLSRRSVDELIAANDVLAALKLMTTTPVYEAQHHGEPRLRLAHQLGKMNANAVAVRCVYVEFCDDPKLDVRVPKMLESIDVWESKIWRRAGHVRLGMERCLDRVDRELKRRQASVQKRKSRMRERRETRRKK